MNETLTPPAAAPDKFLLNVVDEDKMHLPDDLITKGKDTKMWIYILAGTVVIFVAVFALLSKQTSLFKGYTVTNKPAEITDPLDDFNDNAADRRESVVDADVDADSAPRINAENVVGTVDAVESDPADGEAIVDDSIVGDLSSLSSIPVYTPETNPIAYIPQTPTLGSYTNVAVVQTPNVQGNTGPALWIAMIPVALYWLRNKKLNFIYGRTK